MFPCFQVKQWGAYFGEAGLETLTLLEFRDPDALRDLIKTPELSTLLTPFRAGDRALAVVPSERLAEVQQLLAAFGVPVRSSVAR